ncbi:Leucyl aminopeptidase [Chthoniobacter flavus Ellin428]|uniref:Probable cytosol aminopeptidase n=1 Tax=Chthoniobacter flavus Ellin428 TaxID=497964 RepID=B4D990_9BACT|nr:leucyl aminopeptidase [Chthoniobacter flavus]EDY16993.1 Leucyl aminopeptidase [Chthoniobacter flavus Ellin428]TCO86078.1 leucyl aminopeptidase [Chthoniobacter flavus]
MKISVGPEAPAKRAITVRFVPKDARGKITPPVTEAEFSGKANALFYARNERVLCVGLGQRAKIDAATFRSAAGAATIFLKKIDEHHLALHLDDWPQFAGPAVEGALLADYRFERFKTRKTAGLAGLSVQVLAGDVAAAKRAVRRSEAIATATNVVREVGNLPGNLLYPGTLAQQAEKLGRTYGFKVRVFDEKALRAGKFGGLLAVGQGSVRPPRMIVLEHRGGAKTDAPVAMVGKAITFDTGGISIKPAANMEEMIFDKCGGIAVLGAMAAMAALGVKRNVVGVIASAENMPGGNAYRPGDIVTTYDGKHIEIVNTDAEGRVVLADAIAYARQDLNAAAIVDLATLTGACGVALGEYAAGFWSNDDKLRQRVLDAAATAGECIWHMPMFEDYERQIRSDVALIKNSGGRLGGACTAAAFLKTFAEDTPWAHLDIAYTGHREKDRADMARGATGFGIRTLVELVENWK